jgi:hypothetical protein
MAQLILLLVAAAWLAVLIPPMLRSRVENRPNSSVTDFRRQLTKLQNTATPPRGAIRAMGRPLAQSPLARPAAPGRPSQPLMRSGVTRRPTQSELAQVQRGSTLIAPARSADPTGESLRYRSHGDPSGGQRRPARPAADRHAFDRAADRADRQRRPQQREQVARDEFGSRAHGDPTGGQRRPADATGEIKRRRSNVLFALVITTASTLFLAATMSSDVMLYLFVASFLSLSTYVYLLSQQANGQRAAGVGDGWAESY